jgi:hypothetical protein
LDFSGRLVVCGSKKGKKKKADGSLLAQSQTTDRNCPPP